jgi:hypothetical protein
MSWHEVVAQAFISEDRSKAKAEKNEIKIELKVTKIKSKLDILKKMGKHKKLVAEEVDLLFSL